MFANVLQLVALLFSSVIRSQQISLLSFFPCDRGKAARQRSREKSHPPNNDRSGQNFIPSLERLSPLNRLADRTAPSDEKEYIIACNTS